MRFTTDIEIPRLVVSVDFEATSWGDAIAQASEMNPLRFIKTTAKSSLMDSDKSRVVTLILQD